MDDSVRKSIENFDIPNPFRSRSVVDFAICQGMGGLAKVIHEINHSGFCFLTVTQSGDWYTVFFRRPAA